MAKNLLRTGIHGAAGRMGRRLVALGIEDQEIEIAAALEHANHTQLGDDAGNLIGVGDIGVLLSSELPDDLQVVIDFSVPEAVDRIINQCLSKSLPMVIATTGLSEDTKQLVSKASAQIPIVFAPSMSLAVNLCMKMSMIAGKTLKNYAPGADVEIIERHHRFKEDAPSGTALRFGELIADVMGQTDHIHGRSGRPGQRPRHEIGYHALRTGDNPGEHTIVFGLMGETIEITVKATNRDCYALGALAAAKFVAKQSAGLYTMFDVLGL